jgi:hypothetical protein
MLSWALQYLIGLIDLGHDVYPGWRLRSAREVTATLESYWDYIRNSKGEFSVCKHVFVETRSGWFSDRSAAYLASGRPVILEETGFSANLPCGNGLFAAATEEEAAEALAKFAASILTIEMRPRDCSGPSGFSQGNGPNA